MFYLRLLIIGCLAAFFSNEDPVPGSTNLKNTIQIHAEPFLDFDPENTQRRTFGDLEFRGGLELSCSDPSFGGISALRVQSDGEHFLALSDRAYWLRGRIVYDGNRPVAVADAEIAPVIGPDGKHARQWDTESIAEDGRGGIYLGVEGIDRIPYFLFDTSRFPVFRDAIPFPPGAKDLPENGGLEGLEYIPKKDSSGGTLVAFSERGLDTNGNLTAFLVEGSDIKTFAVKRSGEYDISDAVLLKDGDVLILERKYDVEDGLAIRIRRIPGDSIKPGAVIDGSIVLEVGRHCRIDNMEAVSVHYDASGKTVLTLVSDDNYSPSQRTLLLQFTLTGK